MAAATDRLRNWFGLPRLAKRGYDAANRSRRTSGWLTRSSGANSEIGTTLATLRDRHRDLARNNPWARRAIAAIVNNTIGPGIRAQWSDPQRQALWSNWFEREIDADGRVDGYGLQALTMRAIVESGEALVRRRPRRPADGLTVPLQIQVLEPDYLDHTKSGALTNGGWIVQGVEFNAIGRRVAYWLFREHPGDKIASGAAKSERYDAADILHIYRIDRPGQARGVPWGTGSMLRLRMLDDYADAQLERHRLAACYMAFVRDADGMTSDATSTELVDKLEPGVIEILPPGRDVSFAVPPQPENDKEFRLGILQSCAADYGVPYETLTGDLSQVNFSSARMGWNEFGRNIDTWRWHMLQPLLLNPLAAWFQEALGVSGLDAAEPEIPLWTAPARVLVDATREIPAIKDAVRAGLMSLPEAIRQQGYDPETLITEHADFLQRLDALGVQLDTDPRADKAAPEKVTHADDENAPDPDTPRPH